MMGPTTPLGEVYEITVVLKTTDGLQNGEALAVRRAREAIVATDQIKPLGILVGGRQCRRQLQGVGRAQGMKPEQSRRTLAHLLERLDLDPGFGQQPKLVQ